MNVGTTIERLLQATPEQQRRIDDILAGHTEPQVHTGPLLMKFTEAAKYAGISRSTLWRLCTAGHIPQIEIRPGSFRVKTSDIQRFAETGLKIKTNRKVKS